MNRPPRTDPTLIDLRGLEPTGERLLEIVRLSLDSGAREVSVDWGDRFPWSVDRSLRGPDVFPEEVVAEVGRLVAGRGGRLTMVLRERLPGLYSSRIAYRHVERAASDHDPHWRHALGKLVADLAEDVLSVLPDLAAVEVAPEYLEPMSCAANELGLECVPLEADDGGIPAQSGSVEERLERGRHPAASGRSIVEIHDAVRAWRDDGWFAVGDLHERLIAAEAVPSQRDRDLVASMKRLAAVIRRERQLHRELVQAYDGLATERAVARFIRRCGLPLREQYGQLSARVSAIRSLR